MGNLAILNKRAILSRAEIELVIANSSYIITHRIHEPNLHFPFKQIVIRSSCEKSPQSNNNKFRNLLTHLVYISSPPYNRLYLLSLYQEN